jgi:hypothetical protein
MQALAKLQICFQADPKDLETLGLLAQAFTLIGQEAKASRSTKRWLAWRASRTRPIVQPAARSTCGKVAPSDDQVAAFDSVMPRGSVPASARAHRHASLSDSTSS